MSTCGKATKVALLFFFFFGKQGLLYFRLASNLRFSLNFSDPLCPPPESSKVTGVLRPVWFEREGARDRTRALWMRQAGVCSALFLPVLWLLLTLGVVNSLYSLYCSLGSHLEIPVFMPLNTFFLPVYPIDFLCSWYGR